MSSIEGHKYVEPEAGEPRGSMVTLGSLSSKKCGIMASAMLAATMLCGAGASPLNVTIPSLTLAKPIETGTAAVAGAPVIDNDHVRLAARDEPESVFTSTLINGGVMVPISTQTELETFYSISMPMPSTTSTSSATEEGACNVEVVTKTKTWTNIVTVTSWPTTLSTEDETMTGDASTVTDVKTEVSGFPVVTVSGGPSTVTEVYASYSVTTATPAASTTTGTSITPFTTITISDLFPPVLPTDEPEVIVTASPLYPMNGTVTPSPTDGTLIYDPVLTITPISGSGAVHGKALYNLGGTLLLVAAAMYML